MVATAQRKSTADPTFAGLAHLVAPAAELADLGRLTGAIDAIIDAEIDGGIDRAAGAPFSLFGSRLG